MKRCFIWNFLLVACVAGMVLGAASARAQSVSNLFTDTTSVFVPFDNVPASGPIDTVPQMPISFGSSRITNNVNVDTGSQGISVSRDIFNPSGPGLGPGSVTYTSSGVVNNGELYDTAVNFYNDGKIVATSTVRVLVVDSVSCLPDARNCMPVPVARGVLQMGVGFGQELGGQPDGTPVANPFLNVTSTSVGGTPSAGYIVTQRGVQLGLTAANTQGYSLVKLAPFTQFSTAITGASTPEWVLAPATVAVNGQAGSGGVLSDTGVTGMYLQPAAGTVVRVVNDPGVECGSQCVAPGTVVQIYMPGQSTPVASYTVTVGTSTNNERTQAGNALSPNFVALVPPYSPAFVNTTVNFLNGYNYLYDATDGFVGYQWNGQVSSTYGGATPAFALQGSVTLPGGFATSLPIYLMDVSQLSTEANSVGFVDRTGQAVTLATPGSATFRGPIAGTPDLIIGGGTINLWGSNTYTGATTINAGATLALLGTGSIAASSGVVANGIFDISGTAGGASVGTLSGTGVVSLGGQMLTLSHASRSFGGVLADGGLYGGAGGGLAIAGGIQMLTGTNTYTGATTIGAGAVLALGGTGSIALSSGVTANGAFDISQTSGGAQVAALVGSGMVNLGNQALTITNALGGFSGVIADGGLGGGAGGRVIVAGGTQALTGVNTYTGGTTITGGATLAINADAALGAAGAPLTLNNGTLLALGSIATMRPIAVESGGGTINADGFSVLLGGPLTADGPLNIMGTVLLGANATIGGTLTVAAGQLSANAGVTATALVVSDGTTLRGIGVVTAPTTVGGTLAPGNSPGTLTVTAPVTMLPGSTTQFDIDGTGTGTGAGSYSRLLVTGAGSSFTAAGMLAPLLRGITGSATNSYTPPLGQSFVVVDAQGGVQGSYNSLTQPAGLAPGTRFDALYGAETLALVVTPQSYGSLALAGIAETANQSSVGSALDAGRPIAGVAMTAGQSSLYAPLYSLPGSAIPSALDALAPTIDADGLMVWRDAWYLVGGAIGAAMETRRGGQPDSQEQTAEGPKGSTIWLTALGQFDSVGSAGGVPGYSGSTGGVVAGVDLPALPWLTAGGALAFTSPQVSTKNSQTFSGQALQVTAYGSAHQGIFFLDGQFGGLFFQDTTQRPLPAYGAQADGQTGGTGVGGSLRAGAHLQVASWQVEPSLGLAGLGLSQGGFTETQAGPANLTMGSQGLTSIQSVLAARVERRFAVNETMALIPTARIGWLHEFADTVGTATASFAGGAAPFSVESAPIGRDAALIGLGATLQTGGPVSLYLAYNGAFAQNANAQTLTGGMSMKW